MLALVAAAFDVTSLTDMERIQGLPDRGASTGIREYIEPWAWSNGLPRSATRTELESIQSYGENGTKVYLGEEADAWGV